MLPATNEWLDRLMMLRYNAALFVPAPRGAMRRVVVFDLDDTLFPEWQYVRSAGFVPSTHG